MRLKSLKSLQKSQNYKAAIKFFQLISIDREDASSLSVKAKGLLVTAI